MRTLTIDPVACLTRADLLLLLAEMLEPPEAWTFGARRVPPEDSDALAAGSGLAEVPRGAASLGDALRAWRDVDVRAAAAEYRRLFDGATACPCNETAYVRRDKGAILADVAGFYRAFGFEVSASTGEKHDHVVVELQFAACLMVLLRRALVTDDDGNRDIVLTALRKFLRDHPAMWIESFATRLEDVAGLPFYVSVGRFARALWEALRAGHALPEDGKTAAAPVEEAGSPYECGMCEPGIR